MKNVVITTVLATTLLTGCAGTYNKATTGAALGALTGTALAYGLGKDSSKKNLWLIAGAAAGGLIGNLETDNIIESVITGSAIASFTVSEFGVGGLLNIKTQEINDRINYIKSLIKD